MNIIWWHLLQKHNNTCSLVAWECTVIFKKHSFNKHSCIYMQLMQLCRANYVYSSGQILLILFLLNMQHLQSQVFTSKLTVCCFYSHLHCLAVSFTFAFCIAIFVKALLPQLLLLREVWSVCGYAAPYTANCEAVSVLTPANHGQLYFILILTPAHPNKLNHYSQKFRTLVTAKQYSLV